MPNFDPTAFLTMYPQFSSFTSGQLTAIYTNEALVAGSKVLACFSNTNTQFYYAQLVLAHILTIYQLGLTGRTTSVTEDSVTGQFDYSSTVDSAWWDKTVFGQQCYRVLLNRGGATAFFAAQPTYDPMGIWQCQ